MKILKNKKGLSLIEVLIAISLFTVAALISSRILIDIAQLEKKSSIQNAIYEDLRMVLQQLTNEIQNGTIDYEEYYNYYVIQNGGAVDNVFYGVNYGLYGSRFYDPGKSLDGAVTNNPDDLGMECSFPNPLGDEECEVVYTLSTDLNVGHNPFYGEEEDSNAFCDNGRGQCPGNVETDHLFLIDNTGTKKTIIAPKQIAGGMALGLIRMVGQDLDQNGIIDTFSCMEEFNCDALVPTAPLMPLEVLFPGENKYANIRIPKKSDLAIPFSSGTLGTTQFMPISPLRSSIKAKFIISPLEDPYKAFGEENMQLHPSVTIILTVDLSEETKKDYPGTFQQLTIQTTVAAGVIGRIDSYPSVNQFKSAPPPPEPSYIKDIFNYYGINNSLDVSL